MSALPPPSPFETPADPPARRPRAVREFIFAKGALWIGGLIAVAIVSVGFFVVNGGVGTGAPENEGFRGFFDDHRSTVCPVYVEVKNTLGLEVAENTALELLEETYTGTWEEALSTEALRMLDSCESNVDGQMNSDEEASAANPAPSTTTAPVETDPPAPEPTMIESVEEPSVPQCDEGERRGLDDQELCVGGEWTRSPTTTAVPTTTGFPGTTAARTTTDPVVERGDTGDAVRELQQALLDAGYSVGSAGVDGEFGAATAAAIARFSRDEGVALGNDVVTAEQLAVIRAAPGGQGVLRSFREGPLLSCDFNSAELVEPLERGALVDEYVWSIIDRLHNSVWFDLLTGTVTAPGGLDGAWPSPWAFCDESVFVGGTYDG